MKNNSDDDDEQQVKGMHGPHPTTGHRLPGHLCPLRPCRCDTAHSQCEHLATRASGACGQGVGAPSPLSKTILQLDGNASLQSESEDDLANDDLVSTGENYPTEDESNEYSESEIDENADQKT